MIHAAGTVELGDHRCLLRKLARQLGRKRLDSLVLCAEPGRRLDELSVTLSDDAVQTRYC